ncbi:MAG: hypothetical protein QW210_04175, partial [Candidatus Woesearchaeota archaeon]
FSCIFYNFIDSFSTSFVSKYRFGYFIFHLYPSIYYYIDLFINLPIKEYNRELRCRKLLPLKEMTSEEINFLDHLNQQTIIKK